MKKQWIAPKAEGERFLPNEYCQQCQEGVEVYKFECNAGGGVYGSIYEETNGIAGLQIGNGGDSELAKYSKSFWEESGFHACGSTHDAPTTDSFPSGYYLPHGDSSKAVPVVIWKEPKWFYEDIHATTKLNAVPYPERS